MARVLDEFADNKWFSYVSYAEEFEKLPLRAKEIYFYAMENLAQQHENIAALILDQPFAGSEDCQSPIEKILYVACNIVFRIRDKELDESAMGMSVFPQFSIETEKKNYCADFIIVLEKFVGKCVDVIVECDGHEFHQKTKAQVERDNQREYDIKKMGYDVLRFSGSQIYNNPFKCANDIFDYLIAKDGRK